MKLSELTDEYKKAIDELLSMSALTEIAFNDTLEGIQGEIKQKAMAVGVYITDLERERKELEKQEVALIAQRKKMDKNIDKLKSYLLRHLVEYIHLSEEITN